MAGANDSSADHDARAHLAVPVDPRRVGRVLAVVVAGLIATTFLAQLLRWKGVDRLARFFDSNVKVNIPTGYKVFALTAGALIILAIARLAKRSGDRWAREWHWLAGVVGFLALDETIYLHQSVSEILDDRDILPGSIHFSWILFYLPLAAIVVLILLRFIFALPSDTKRRFIAAGLLFGGGAGGIEIVKGKLADTYGETAMQFRLAAAFSDSLEEIGLAVLIVAALIELARRSRGVRFDVRSDAPAE